MKKVIKENKRYIILLVVITMVFIALKIINNFEAFTRFDIYIQKIFDEIRNPNYTKLLSIMSDLLGAYIPIIILVIMLLMFNKKVYFKVQFVSYMFTLFMTVLLKNVIQRQRPTLELVSKMDIFSFPSGHTLTSFVFYYLLAYIMSVNYDKKTKISYNIIATIIVSTVAMTRLYLGVHYITDIIGGVLFGIIILKLIKNIIKKKYERKLV